VGGRTDVRSATTYDEERLALDVRNLVLHLESARRVEEEEENLQGG